MCRLAFSPRFLSTAEVTTDAQPKAPLPSPRPTQRDIGGKRKKQEEEKEEGEEKPDRKKTREERRADWWQRKERAKRKRKKTWRDGSGT